MPVRVTFRLEGLYPIDNDTRDVDTHVRRSYPTTRRKEGRMYRPLGSLLAVALSHCSQLIAYCILVSLLSLSQRFLKYSAICPRCHEPHLVHTVRDPSLQQEGPPPLGRCVEAPVFPPLNDPGVPGVAPDRDAPSGPSAARRALALPRAWLLCPAPCGGLLVLPAPVPGAGSDCGGGRLCADGAGLPVPPSPAALLSVGGLALAGLLLLPPPLLSVAPRSLSTCSSFRS